MPEGSVTLFDEPLYHKRHEPSLKNSAVDFSKYGVPLKANMPTELTPLPVTLLSDEQLQKALSPIE